MNLACKLAFGNSDECGRELTIKCFKALAGFLEVLGAWAFDFSFLNPGNDWGLALSSRCFNKRGFDIRAPSGELSNGREVGDLNLGGFFDKLIGLSRGPFLSGSENFTTVF